MKKLMAICLVITIAISISACSANSVTQTNNDTENEEQPKEQPVEAKMSPLEIAQKCYQILAKFADVADSFGADICIAWYAGIWNDSELINDGIQFLGNKLALTEDELRDGAANVYLTKEGINVSEVSDEQWEEARQQANQLLINAQNEGSLFDTCIDIVCRAYLENGAYELIDDSLPTMKEPIKALDGESEYYEPLKSYYSVVKTYCDWCENPYGSYNDAEELLKNYREDCQQFKNKLDFDLGE